MKASDIFSVDFYPITDPDTLKALEKKGDLKRSGKIARVNKEEGGLDIIKLNRGVLKIINAKNKPKIEFTVNKSAFNDFDLPSEYIESCVFDDARKKTVIIKRQRNMSLSETVSRMLKESRFIDNTLRNITVSTSDFEIESEIDRFYSLDINGESYVRPTEFVATKLAKSKQIYTGIPNTEYFTNMLGDELICFWTTSVDLNENHKEAIGKTYKDLAEAFKKYGLNDKHLSANIYVESFEKFNVVCTEEEFGTVQHKIGLMNAEINKRAKEVVQMISENSGVYGGNVIHELNKHFEDQFPGNEKVLFYFKDKHQADLAKKVYRDKFSSKIILDENGGFELNNVLGAKNLKLNFVQASAMCAVIKEELGILLDFDGQ